MATTTTEQPSNRTDKTAFGIMGYTPVAEGVDTPQSMTRVSLSLARCSAKVTSSNGRTCHIDSTDGRRATYTDGKLVRRMSARVVGTDGCYVR